MVQHVLQFVPATATASATALLLLAAGVGLVLWVIGARMSRYVVTLFTVLLGASVGMRMPEWFDWSISGAGPAVAGALLLGVTGFAVHGGWVGALFGAMLGLWSALAVWVFASDGLPMRWPVIHEFTTLGSFWQEWWLGLPPQVAKLLPYTTSAALVSGLACAILWTRLTTVLAWSLTGATMFLFGALSAVAITQPHWLEGRLPQPTVQVAIFVLLVIVGAAIQWKLVPATSRKKQSKARSSERPGLEEVNV